MSHSDKRESSGRFFELLTTDATRYVWCRVLWDSLQGRGRFPRQLVDFDGTVLLIVNTGTVAPDIIGNDVLLNIASERVIEIMESNRLTGWTTYRVRITCKGKELTGYRGLGISGRGGPNDAKAYRGGLVPGTTLQTVSGLYPTGWDGSDLFTLDDIPGAVLVTERVRRIFIKEKVTNCKFRPAEDFKV